MKKTLILMAFAMMAALSANAQRQRMSEEEMAKMRAEQIQKQAEQLAKDIKLEKEDRPAFIELYTKYQNELSESMMQNMQQRRNRGEETDAFKMSDEDCFAKIAESLTNQEKQIEQSQKRLEITKKYMAEFMGANKYSAQQLYKIFAEQRRGGMGGFGGGMGGFGGGMGGFGGGNRGGGGGFGGNGGGGFGGGF